MIKNVITETSTHEPATTPSRIRAPRKSLVALRMIAVGQLLALFLQPVLASSYLSGALGLHGLHGLNALIVSIFTLCQSLASLIYAWRGGGRWWPLIFSVELVLLVETVKALGGLRLVAIQIPIGGLLIILQLIFTGWTLTARAAMARKPRVQGEKGGRDS